MNTAQLRGFVPGLALLAGRRGPGLRRDLLAGVVLAALLVPQGMGYAQLAGLPPITGLYATLIPLVVYFLLGPSRILIISPDSAVCPLVAAAIIPLAGADPDQRVALAGLLALVVGAIMLAGGLARFGFVTELLSMPVRVGYLAGISLTVIVSQLPKLFGFSVDAENFIGAVRGFITGLDETDPTALAFGVGCLAVILVLRLISRKLPGVLIAVVGATALVALLGLSDELPIVGAVPSGLPELGWPDVALDDATALLGAAVGIAFVAFADTSVLSRSYAARLHQPVDQNRELAALGAANLAAGVFQGFPVSSSGSRTAVVEDMGARSQLAGLAGARHARRAAAGRHRPRARHAAQRPGCRGDRRRARPVRRARRPAPVPLAADRVRALPRRVRRRRRGRRAVGCRDRDRAEPAQLHPPLLVPARRRARPRGERQGLPRHPPLPGRLADPRPGPVPLRRAAVLRQRRQLRRRVSASSPTPTAPAGW